LSYSMLKEYPKCLVCDETPNRKRVNAVMAEATTYDNNPFDPRDPVIVSGTEIYCCTECYMMGVVTQEDALEALWNRTLFYR
jgi:nitrate reductase cytochrome c-type subunit